jgi:hypothetical protein
VKSHKILAVSNSRVRFAGKTSAESWLFLLEHQSKVKRVHRVFFHATGFAQGMDAFLVSPKVGSAEASGPEWLEPLG